MNYIKQINSFYDRLETNPLSTNAIALWYALMATANKAGWIDKFAVALSVLEVKSGLQRRSIERARNELSQKGYITWHKRGGVQSAVYSLTSLCVISDIHCVAPDGGQGGGLAGGQPVVINKLNETKLNETFKEKVKQKEKPICFSIPTIDEVENYFISEKGLIPSDAQYRAEYFFNFYDSKGWMVGKNKMFNWKSSATKSLLWDDKRINTANRDAYKFSKSAIADAESAERKRQIVERALRAANLYDSQNRTEIWNSQ